VSRVTRTETSKAPLHRSRACDHVSHRDSVL
jgi:hypothetical protein